ncbi:acyl-CoA dehydrogenase family protein [Nocardia lijiangensis]|uniref:acyl-CoA dehydrogenase family protein n=1 Tax=Nocardia lijiangensis TaxID=299618 RepID=UPI00082F154B|nr:acyl-CoA dehydrogenase family protein [Nocardia lijiangensis]
MDFVLDYLLTEPPGEPVDSVTAAWARHRAVAARFAAPVDAAVAGGFAADRLGFAFLSGYQEALRTLLPEFPAEDAVAVSATEAGGAHPSAIRTVLTERDGAVTVSGTKTFTTLGSLARRLVVIASAGAAADGRNMLRAALVETAAPGVTVTDLPAVPFAPEIPHATVTFTDAPATPLPGDGYTDFLKPFRTIEDVHVLAAALGWLVRVARESSWPRPVLQKLLVLVAAVRGLDLGRPGSPGVHIALGGVFEEFARVVDELAPLWEAADPIARERWERDRPLFGTAGRVRAQRLATAWRAVGFDDETTG